MVLSTRELILMGLLPDRARSGIELHREFDIPLETAYSALHRLLARDEVEALPRRRNNAARPGPAEQLYRLTPKGKSAAVWLRDKKMPSVLAALAKIDLGGIGGD